MTSRVSVAVIGAGTGGLCLAQGLRAAGVPVTVHERDRSPDDQFQGYRVRINPVGARALRDCLPPEAWEEFLACAGRTGNTHGFLTERLRELSVIGGSAEMEAHYSAGRRMLRQVLLTGLEDVVRFGARFERYERGADGRVTAFFADGSQITADLLIGADGANSRVRSQHLPHARRVETGMISVAGRLPLSEAREILPECLSTRPNSVIAPRGCGMFVAPHEISPGEGYVMWAYGAGRHRYPADDPTALPPEGLRAVVSEMIRNWHPRLRQLVARTDPTTIGAVSIRTSVPPGPWPPSNVTVLGDAIHSMTPLRGIGANMALHDAAILTRELAGVTGGADELRAAVHRYEIAMRRDGFRAVAESLRAARQFVSENPVKRLMFKTVLRASATLPPLQRALFAQHG